MLNDIIEGIWNHLYVIELPLNFLIFIVVFATIGSFVVDSVSFSLLFPYNKKYHSLRRWFKREAMHVKFKYVLRNKICYLTRSKVNWLIQLLQEYWQTSLTTPVFSFTQFESGTSEKFILHRLSRASPLQFKTLHNTPGW